MKSNPLQAWRQTDIVISFVVFAFLIVFTYGILFLTPYPGFYFNPTTGVVTAIYEDRAPVSVAHLQVGDVLKQVGSVRFEEYASNLKIKLFEKYRSGETVEIVVERNGQDVTVPWIYVGFSKAEFPSHFFNIWWLAYAFWLIGTATQIFMRPKDRRWALFVAANYLTGMFIMLGSVSWTGFLNSPILLRVVAFLLLPVYLHFHWIFPHSLRSLPRWVKLTFYFICIGLAISQFFITRANPVYFLAVILAFGGSILLLAVHLIFQPRYRSELGILAIAAFLSLGFTIIASIIASNTGQTPRVAVLSLFALPVLPLTYFYLLYRNSLGGLELRTNRAISLYIFLVILGAVLLVAGFLGYVSIQPEAFVLATVMTALLATFVGVQIFPAFQSFVERRLLGVKLPAQNMVESYSARIVMSNTLSALLKLLEDEVFPSLLIRQYAFIRVMDPSVSVILSREVDREQLSDDMLKDAASLSTGRLLPLSRDGQPSSWIRLILPLRVGSDLIGAWLLGRRDPDDHYPQVELPILQSLANQTAIALSNIIQTERLRVMYEANINRYEQERLRLGHELHDSLLNEMAAMLMKYDPDVLPHEFQESFDGLILRLREIVQDLRPPMLLYGLKHALDGLADNLSERHHDAVQIVSEIQVLEDCRYPEVVEHNVYRIVQEACENAVKYAHARAIRISGELAPGRIRVQVMDDGVGFKDDVSLLLDDMVANKHYGLAGMHERAELTGAVIRIESRPSQGAKVQVLWEMKETI